MDDQQNDSKRSSAQPNQEFTALIGAKEKRKIWARRHFRNTWFGFSVFGLIGWSVAIPTLLGIALGVWLDSHHPSRYSWTLMLLIGGLGVGCLNAWHWVSRENDAIRREQERKNNHG
jgi:ATP synthase protein I